MINMMLAAGQVYLRSYLYELARTIMGSRVHEEWMRRSQRVQQFARPARQAGSTAPSAGTRVGRQLTRTAAGEVARWASLSHCGRGAAAHVGVQS